MKHLFVATGYGCFRIELVDEPADCVEPLLHQRAVSDAVAGNAGSPATQVSNQEMWEWMATLPNSHGRVAGIGVGSLEVREERSVNTMKRTAAMKRAMGK
jgi:hypothetical protein